MAKCTIHVQDLFGPVAQCYGGFDFTLFFEETILTLVPTSVVLLLLPFLIPGVLRSRARVLKTWHHIAKLVNSLLSENRQSVY